MSDEALPVRFRCYGSESRRLYRTLRRDMPRFEANMATFGLMAPYGVTTVQYGAEPRRYMVRSLVPSSAEGTEP